jgi:hypothetical protein
MDGCTIKKTYNENGSYHKKCVKQALYKWVETIGPTCNIYVGVGAIQVYDKPNEWYLCFYADEGTNIPNNIMDIISNFCHEMDVRGCFIEVSDDYDDSDDCDD